MNPNSNGYDGGSSGRVTVKDLYDVVGRVEGKVDELKDQVNTVTINQEHRITEQSTRQELMSADMAIVKTDLQTLRDEHNRAKGHINALAWVAGALGTMFCGIGGVVLAHVFHL